MSLVKDATSSRRQLGRWSGECPVESSNEYDMNQKWQRVNQRGVLGIRRWLRAVGNVMAQQAERAYFRPCRAGSRECRGEYKKIPGGENRLRSKGRAQDESSSKGGEAG